MESNPADVPEHDEDEATMFMMNANNRCPDRDTEKAFTHPLHGMLINPHYLYWRVMWLVARVQYLNNAYPDSEIVRGMYEAIGLLVMCDTWMPDHDDPALTIDLTHPNPDLSDHTGPLAELGWDVSDTIVKKFEEITGHDFADVVIDHAYCDHGLESIIANHHDALAAAFTEELEAFIRGDQPE